MGKKAKQSTFEKKNVSFYDSFKGLKNNGGFNIIYNVTTGRFNLTKDTVIFYSDISVDACKNVAQERYLVSEWSNM